MAKQKVNKSELIREALRENPSASNAEITAELAKQGYTVTAALISQAKKHGGKKTKRRRRPKTRGKAEAAPAVGTRSKAGSRSAAGTWPAARKSDQLPLDRMLMAADFSKACGGIDSAIATLNSLKKIADKL